MKKNFGIALVSLLTFIIVPVNAQINFGIKGGVNISSVHFNKDIANSDNITGFNIGPMIEIMVPYVGVGVDAAVLYSQKGMKNVSGISYLSSASSYMPNASSASNNGNLTTDYIDVPVNFKWKFGLPVLKGYLAAGPYLGFKVGGDKIWNIPGNVNAQIETQSFAAGLNFGLGVEVLRHLQVGFNYELGLTNNYSGVRDGISGGIIGGTDGKELFEGKHRGWTISAAILF
ncbi:MAG: PorT family protein [Tannerellaceae bacterium]|jgi:hypothetical protein|nr:PorT family protein [Tannerellaceae bacterium]